MESKKRRNAPVTSQEDDKGTYDGYKQELSVGIIHRIIMLDISVAELSRRADVPPTTIYSIINRGSRRVDIRSIVRIAHALGTTIDGLLNDEMLSQDETELLLQYRDLSDNGKKLLLSQAKMLKTYRY